MPTQPVNEAKELCNLLRVAVLSVFYTAWVLFGVLLAHYLVVTPSQHWDEVHRVNLPGLFVLVSIFANSVLHASLLWKLFKS